MVKMLDYKKQPIEIGDSIKNIESHWHGRIIAVEGEGSDTMLKCQGINWWTGELDADDIQWHSPYDVIKAPPNPRHMTSINPLNFL